MVGRVWVLKARWTLRDLVDFEALAGRGEEARAVDEGRVRAAVKGLEGAEARRVGFVFGWRNPGSGLAKRRGRFGRVEGFWWGCWWRSGCFWRG